MTGQGSADQQAMDELAAIAAAAAADAGAAPAEALDFSIEVMRETAPSPQLAAFAEDARRLRYLRHIPETGFVPRTTSALFKILRFVVESERNGDDLRLKLDMYLKSQADTREIELRKRIESVPVYMIVVLVLFFVPAILLVLIGPAFLSLLRSLYEV